MQIHRGSAHCLLYFATVISSAILFICIAPSPTMAITGRPGYANFAAIAYGSAIMSLVQSAKLNGHDPYAYLKDVLIRLPTHAASRVEELLPHIWPPSSSN